MASIQNFVYWDIPMILEPESQFVVNFEEKDIYIPSNSRMQNMFCCGTGNYSTENQIDLKPLSDVFFDTLD